MKNTSRSLNILICGSQKFDDESFVFGALDALFTQTNENIASITTSKFSGACQFAELWVEQKNMSLSKDKKIEIKHFLFDNHLMEKNQTLYEDLAIPDEVLQNDAFFKKGKELIIKEGILLVMAFPNPEGKLGAATQNITRFASMAGAQVLDCSKLLSHILKFRNEQVSNEVEEVQEEGHGFNNKNPSKKFK